jgi:hypothetical protein
MMMSSKVLIFIGILIFLIIATTILKTSIREGFPHSFLSNPQLQRGDEFYLRTVDGDYVSVCQSCEPTDQNLTNRCKASLCLKANPVRSSVFTYLPHRDGTFSVQTTSGKYWKRCENCFERCPGIICADGVNVNLQPAKFVLIKRSDVSGPLISIKTDTGRMLEMHECDQSCGRVVASLGVGLNRQFVIEKLPPPYKPPVRVRQPTKKFRAPSSAPTIIPFQD